MSTFYSSVILTDIYILHDGDSKLDGEELYLDGYKLRNPYGVGHLLQNWRQRQVLRTVKK